jgi:hypothetical protein
MKRGKSRRGRFRRGDETVAGEGSGPDRASASENGAMRTPHANEDRTMVRLRAACLACRLLALAACAGGLALAVHAQAHAAHPAGAAAPGLTLALLGAIVAGLAGRQR